MKIKEWFMRKIEAKARIYNCFIDLVSREDNLGDLVEDGCVYAYVQEKLDETEKAVKVKFSTGSVVGSYKGWTTWVPKSVIEIM